MAKKTKITKAEPSKAPVRRTKTIQKIIEENQDIINEKIGARRSLTKPIAPQIKKAISKPTKTSSPKISKSKPKNKVSGKAVPKKEEPKKEEPKKTTPKKETKKVISKAGKKAITKKATTKKATTKKATTKKAEATTSPKKKSNPSKLAEVSKSGKKSANLEKKQSNLKDGQPPQVKTGPRRTESKATAGIVDVVFCCDTTGSMGSYLNECKQVVREIVKNIQVKAQDEDVSVKFGFVCYRDHPPQDSTYVTLTQDLCSDDQVIKFIEAQCAAGGGDAPEAVLDGLYEAAKNISWRDSRSVPSLRYIFHIADAPPHGEEFGMNSNWSKGVPSGMTLDKVTHVINIKEIHYRLIRPRLASGLEKMMKLFSEKFTNYEETDLTHAKEMNFKISDMIIRELCPDVDYDV